MTLDIPLNIICTSVKSMNVIVTQDMGTGEQLDASYICLSHCDLCLNQGQIHTSCTGSNIGSVTTVSCGSQIVVSVTYTDLGRFMISTISTNLVHTLLFTSFTGICLMAHFFC